MRLVQCNAAGLNPRPLRPESAVSSIDQRRASVFLKMTWSYKFGRGGGRATRSVAPKLFAVSLIWPVTGPFSVELWASAPWALAGAARISRAPTAVADIVVMRNLGIIVRLLPLALDRAGDSTFSDLHVMGTNVSDTRTYLTYAYV
jgi:hypothetical protein